MIAYDDTKMDQLFSEIQHLENGEVQTIPHRPRGPEVSLETELWLMLHTS